MAATDFLSRVVVNFDNVLKGDNSTYDSRFDFEEIFDSERDESYLVGKKDVVCKHWLNGLCKKGDKCNFLHVYDSSKMPICQFFLEGKCMRTKCKFRHVDPESKITECPYFNQGFCKYGPKCNKRHVKREICEAYLLGFCPDGPRCKLGHPKQVTKLNPSNISRGIKSVV